MISKLSIDRVLDTADIVEVIGDYVKLKRSGSNFAGLCPFHNEKSPSFSVSPVRRIYKCFGCSAAGNVINFLMAHDKLTYPEAIRALAKRYQITLDEDNERSEEADLAFQEQESLFIANNFAKETFKNWLINEDEGKAIGLSYFQERGVTQESIEKFELGYSLDGKDTFFQLATKNAFTTDVLVKSGLVTQSEYGGNYDRFRARVMFPIHNMGGRVIGFGARTLLKDKKIAKYLNSPETPIYNKSHSLYGIFQARTAIRKSENCYLVEGYTDVISMHQVGVENVVASSGTSLTQEQARLIKRLSNLVTVIYDGDFAGIKASIRGIGILLENDLNVKAVRLPEGEDPDSYAKKIGANAYKEYIESNSIDFISFQASILLEDSGNDPLKRATVIQQMVDTIGLIPNAIKRETFLTKVSELMGVQPEMLLNEVNKARTKALKGKLLPGEQTNSSPESTDFQNETLTYKETLQKPKIPSNAIIERDIMRIIIKYGTEPYDENTNVIEYLISELSDMDWEDPISLLLFNTVQEIFASETVFEQHLLTNHSNPDVQKFAIDLAMKETQLSGNWESKHQIDITKPERLIHEDVDSALGRLKLRKLQKVLQEEMETYKLTEDPELQMQILQDFKALNELKNKLAGFTNTIIL